jgi:hypothetical protein
MEGRIMTDIRMSDFGGIPYGNTSGRPSNPTTGKLYSNGETQRLELYTSSGSWENIVQEVPGVASITGNYSQQTDSGVITIYGTNFVNGAYATAIGSNGVQVNASSTTFNSLVQLTATFTGLSNSYEPYDVKVTNPSNLFGILPDALYINASPVWQTPSGSLGTFNEQVTITLSALSAPDSDSNVTFALASGSTLPSGVTLNSTTGVISGTLPDITTDTTYTFTVNATDGVNTIPRTFSITSKYLIPIEYLLVAGGGGSGSDVGGGGGGGGFVSGNIQLSTQETLSIIVGQGGIGSISPSEATNGSNSVLSGNSISTITALGGGYGGKWNNSPGNNGGSGGGGGANYTFNSYTSGGTATQPGSASGGFGNNGGRGTSSNAPSYGAGGGGGGAGSAGLDATPAPTSSTITSTGGKGGDGKASSITGSSVYYGAGGPGTNDQGYTAGPGLGGVNINSNGTANTGAGAGGGQDNGYSGGSGVVVIAYPNTFPAITTIPGTLTYDQPTRSGYRVYRFTAGTGTITV